MTKPTSPRPLSVKVVSVALFSVSFFSLLYQLSRLARGLPFQTQPAGFSLFGWHALAYTLLLIGLCAWVSVGLWMLQEIARRFAIGYAVYEVLSNLLALFFGARFILMGLQDLETKGMVPWFVFKTWAVLLLPAVASFAFYLMAIRFLIKHKSAFVASWKPGG